MDKKSSIRVMFYMIAVMLIMGIFSGCSWSGEASGFAIITPEEAKDRLDNEVDIVLLDVRTREEYEEGHIEGAILIPLDVLKDEVSDIIKDKDTMVFVYCRRGNRSNTAAGILSDLGYLNVYDMGGIIDWPYEVVK